MAIEKTAGAFKYYNVPVGPNGQPLTRNEHGDYVDSATGKLYDPESHGSVRRVVRPVLNESDLLDKFNFPLQARTLKVKKNQAIIKELQAAVNDSTCGVVNFVIGREKENAEALLKAAFPPGSGVTYKGFDGYDISAAEWGNIEQSRNQLMRTILGNPSGVDRKTLQHYQRLSTEMEGRTPVGNKPKPATPLSVLNPVPASIMFSDDSGGGFGIPQAVPLGGGSRDSAGGSEPGVDPKVRLYMQILDHIEQLQEGADEAMRQMNAIENRHNLEKDPQDPDALSPSKRFDDLKQYYDRCQSYIALRKSELPAIPMPFGGSTYDGTGFLDLSDVKQFYGRLSSLGDPKKVVEYHSSATGNNQAVLNETATRKIYDNHQTAMVKAVKAVQKDAPPDIQQACANVLNIIERPYEQIRSLTKALNQAVQVLCSKMTGQNRILIINNVDQSALVDHSSHEADAPLKFLADEVITDHFAPKTNRKKKAIVFVSRRPLSFGFDGAIWVPKQSSKMLVDEEEGMAIVNLFIDKCRESVRRKIEVAKRTQSDPSKPVDPELQNLSIALVNVDVSDIRRLAQMVDGKTQQAAYDFLYGVFSAVINRKTGGVEGSALSKEARRLRNEEVRDTSTFTDTAGKTFHVYMAMRRMNADLDMEDYIHAKRGNWGDRVEEIQTIIKSVRSKAAEQRALMAKEHKINSGQEQATSSDVFNIKSRIGQLDQESRSQLYNNIKHLIILWGEPGCGKSAYPEAFAKALGYDLVDCDVGQTRGGLVGQSESFLKAMLDSWKRMSDVVIRIDEIDTQLAGKEEEARATHAATQIHQFLTFFQDNEAVLQERNIFVIATCNNLGRVRDAFTSRGEVYEVSIPYDQDTFTDFLKAAIRIMKRNTPIGMVYDPESRDARSSNLWTETENFWKNIEGDIPRMAQALVPTRMPIRTLIDFVRRMFAANTQYMESKARVKMWNDNKEEYKRVYSEFAKKDRSGKVVSWPPPTITGFPFSVDNFCRAAAMTYPTDGKGSRLNPENPKDRENIRQWVFGIADLNQQLNSSGTPSSTIVDNQMELPLFTNQEEEDLMPPASASAIASTDYYYQQLLKSGFAKKLAQQQSQPAPPAIPQPIPQVQPTEQTAPAVQAAPETMRQAYERLARGEFRDTDVYERGVLGIYPVPPARTFDLP